MDGDRESVEAWLREHWPVAVGIAVLVVGHVWLYGILGYDWSPASPPVIVAIAVVIVLEVIRSLVAEWDDR